MRGSKDLRYMTNQDTDLNPKVDQWSNGVNQADELNRLMKVRRSALNRLGEHTIRNGAPMATIEEPLVPIFMYHRYAVESTASMVAGQDYIYAMRGDGRTAVKWETRRQSAEGAGCAGQHAEARRTGGAQAGAGRAFRRVRRASAGIANCSRARRATPSIRISPATIAADVTIGFTLQLDRAARMVAQHAVDPALPGLEEVIDRLVKATFDAPAASPYEAEIRRAEERVLVDRVTWLATGSPNAPGARDRGLQAGSSWPRACEAPRRRANPSRRSTGNWPRTSSASWIVPRTPCA